MLKAALDEKIDAVTAGRKLNVPVVMTREETAKVLSVMDGTAQLIVKCSTGAGCVSWKRYG